MRGRSKRNRPEANSLGVAAPPDSSDEDEDNFSETSRLTSSCSNMDVSKASPTPPPTTRGQPQSTAQAPDATTTSASAPGSSPTTTTALSTVSQPSMMTSVVTYMLSFCETSSGSSDAAAAKSMEEAAIPCPLPEHTDWARALIGSLGKDVSSVGRDFPRQDVKILLGGELAQLTDKNIVVDRTAGVQLISTFGSTSDGDAGLLQVRPPHRQPAEARDSSAPIAGGNRQKIKRTTSGHLSSRDRVIDSLVKVVAIAESVTKLTTSSDSGTVQGEGAGGSTETPPEKKGGTSPTTPTTPGRGSMSARVMESVNRLIGVQDVDLNHSLTIAMMETELIYKNPDYRQGTSPPPPNAPPPIPGSGVVNTHRVYLPSPKCLAIDLLMCFNQGVIFFPSQRLKHLIWVSWTPHLHDLGWSCSFFRSSSHGADHVVVWHEQTIENNLVLLSDADRKNTPQFQLSWKLELVLSCRPSPQQQLQQQGAGGITIMPTGRKEGDESTTEISRDEAIVSSPTLLSTTATAAGQDDVETTQQLPCAFQTAMVTQATMDVTKWTWNEPPNGTKKSPLYQRRQGQFEQLMLDRFGLAPFYAQ